MEDSIVANLDGNVQSAEEASSANTDPSQPVSRLPSTRQVRAGQIVISESQIPQPKSQEVLIEGRVYRPTSSKPPSRKASKAEQLSEPASNEDEAQNDSPGGQKGPGSGVLKSPEPTTDTQEQHGPKLEGPVGPEPDTQQTGSDYTRNDTSEGGVYAEETIASPSKLPQPVPPPSRDSPFASPQPMTEIPNVQIQEPSHSDEAMASNIVVASAVPSMTAVASPTIASTLVPADINHFDQLPQAPENIPSETPILPSNIPAVDLPTLNALPINVVLPDAHVLPAKRRKKLLRRARSIALRRRVLVVLLGRDLANAIHPQLMALGKGASVTPVASVPRSAPVPGVDGAGDLLPSTTLVGKPEKQAALRIDHKSIRFARTVTRVYKALPQSYHICGGVPEAPVRRYVKLVVKRDNPTAGRRYRKDEIERLLHSEGFSLKGRCLGTGCNGDWIKEAKWVVTLAEFHEQGPQNRLIRDHDGGRRDPRMVGVSGRVTGPDRTAD